jgi:hypothetical protein
MEIPRTINDHKLNKAYRLCIIDYFKYFVEENFSPRTAHIDLYAFQRKLEEKYYMVAQEDFIEDFGKLSPLPQMLHNWLNTDIQKMFDQLEEIVIY